MTRFKRIPSVFRFNENSELFDYTPPMDVDDTFIVDISSFVPNKQSLQILARQYAASMLDSLVFDSPDDIASGAVNLLARRKGVDIAELSQHQQYLKTEIERNIKTLRSKGRALRPPSPKVNVPDPDKKD